MIDLLLTANERRQVRTWKLRGTITRIATAKTCDYLVELEGIGEFRHVTAILCNYPRWAEPANVFVVRCIAQTRRHRAGLRWPIFEQLKLNIGINGRGVSEHVWSARNEPGLHDGRLEHDGPWHQICDAVAPSFSITASTPLPRPVVIPTFTTPSGYVYMRLRDLPAEAREAFERLEYHQTRLLVHDVPDAVSAIQMHRFLAG